MSCNLGNLDNDILVSCDSICDEKVWQTDMPPGLEDYGDLNDYKFGISPTQNITNCIPEVADDESSSDFFELVPEVEKQMPLFEYNDFYEISKYHELANVIHEKINMSVQRWGKSFLIAPELCLSNLLKCRGYTSAKIPATTLLTKRPPVSEKQMADYDKQLLMAIRSSDLERVKQLCSEGRSMMACNKFGESILHLAARRSEPRLVHFLLNNGGDLRLLDDYGRNPLHDACWRGEPDFEVIMMIMDRDLDLVRMQDVRGATPLNYIRQEFWMQTCAFLYHQREKYWSLEKGDLRQPIPPSAPTSLSP